MKIDKYEQVMMELK